MNKVTRYKAQGTRFKIQGTRFKIQDTGYKIQETRFKMLYKSSFLYLVSCTLFILTASSCGVYTFKDVSIPPEVKTIKINYIENKARYINPQLSPLLTDALTQKISNQTKLTRTQNDDANWLISGKITNYSVSFSAISGKQTTQNNLTVGVHITFRDNLKDKTDEFDISRDFPFSANLTLSQAETSLQPDIIKNVSDEIFNHIFSNW